MYGSASCSASTSMAYRSTWQARCCRSAHPALVGVSHPSPCQIPGALLRRRLAASSRRESAGAAGVNRQPESGVTGLSWNPREPSGPTITRPRTTTPSFRHKAGWCRRCWIKSLHAHDGLGPRGEHRVFQPSSQRARDFDACVRHRPVLCGEQLLRCFAARRNPDAPSRA